LEKQPVPPVVILVKLLVKWQNVAQCGLRTYEIRSSDAVENFEIMPVKMGSVILL